MKITYLLLTVTLTIIMLQAYTQTDTTKNNSDTIHVGGMIIIKKVSSNVAGSKVETQSQKHRSHVSTSEAIFDLGFANWSDHTDYTALTGQQVVVNRLGQPALNKNDMKLRVGKSSNVNIWFFMQRLNLVKRYISLKYGLGLELYNFRFSSPVSFKESGPNPYAPGSNISHPFLLRDSISFSKNKLSTDYVTIPFMLNLRADPNHDKRTFSISAGVSVGYLYSSRNKQVSSERGKRKNHGDYDIENWKFSYVGEVGLGPIRLYGSYTPASIFQNGLSLLPYSVGIRFSNW